MIEILSDTIPGIRVVKAFKQEAREIGRFNDRNEDTTDEADAIHERWTRFWPLLMYAVHTTMVLVWLFATPRLLGDGPTPSPGVFVSFLPYATMDAAGRVTDRPVLAVGALLPCALAFAAGAMLYVVVEELIPETTRGGNVDIATLGFIAGFAVMMTLDNMLG